MKGNHPARVSRYHCMRTLLITCLVLAACSPEGYYVANVYEDGSGNLSVQKCAISSNNGDPDPSDCSVEPVGPAPRVAPTHTPGTPRALIELLRQ